jgi:hypothetical protein
MNDEPHETTLNHARPGTHVLHTPTTSPTNNISDTARGRGLNNVSTAKSSTKHDTVSVESKRTNRRGPIGGDIRGPLSDSDLDFCLSPLGDQTLRARTLHDVGAGYVAASTVASVITNRLQRWPWIVAPIHGHNHWALLLVEKSATVIQVSIIDSAPSPVTKRTFSTVCKRLQLPEPRIIVPAKQHYASDECGLFVLLFAWTRFLAGDTHVSWESAPMPATISLRTWRTTIENCQRAGTKFTPRDLRSHLARIDPTLITCTPSLKNLLTAASVTGGGDDDLSASDLDWALGIIVPGRSLSASLLRLVAEGAVTADDLLSVIHRSTEPAAETILAPMNIGSGDSAHWITVLLRRRPPGRPQSFPWHIDARDSLACSAHANAVATLAARLQASYCYRPACLQRARQCGAHVIAWALTMITPPASTIGETSAPRAVDLGPIMEAVKNRTQLPKVDTSIFLRSLGPEHTLQPPANRALDEPRPMTMPTSNRSSWRGASNPTGENLCPVNCAGAILWRAKPHLAPSVGQLLEFARLMGFNARRPTGGRRQDDVVELLLTWVRLSALYSDVAFFNALNGVWHLSIEAIPAPRQDHSFAIVTADEGATNGLSDTRRIPADRHHDLIAIIVFDGEDNCGHFRTWLREGLTEVWFHYNDNAKPERHERLPHTIKGSICVTLFTRNSSPIASQRSSRQDSMAPKTEPITTATTALPPLAPLATLKVTTATTAAPLPVPPAVLKATPVSTLPPAQPLPLSTGPTTANPTSNTRTRVPEPKRPDEHVPFLAIRKTLMAHHPGQHFRVAWRHGDEAATWLAVLVHRPQHGAWGQVNYLAALCQHCGEWHDADEDLTGGPGQLWTLPYPGGIYFECTPVPQQTVSEECICHQHSADEDCDEKDDEPLESIPLLKHEDVAPEDRASLAANTGRAKPLAPPQAESETSTLGLIEGTSIVPPSAPLAALRGSVARSWFLVRRGARPPHVHALTWLRATQSTRDLHLVWLERLKAMPADLGSAPLGTAIVELVLRLRAKAGWSWPTVASALSAVSSALRSLPLYTNEVRSIDIRLDQAFAQAQRRAQHLAKVVKRDPRRAAPLTEEMFESIRRSLKNPSAALLLRLAWATTARVGDLRQVATDDISFTPCREGTRCTLVFRRGKGAYWWGPYSVSVALDAQLTLDLQAYLTTRTVSPSTLLFTTADQTALSRCIRARSPELGILSVRKGAIQDLAARGLSDKNLACLTGHRSTRTLLRYLGWGALSADAREAADAAVKLRVSGAGIDSGQARKMGPFSGWAGNKGRRVAPPPEIFPRKPPSALDLGIGANAPDGEPYAFHVKRVPTIRWTEVHRMALESGDDEVVEFLRLAHQWVTDPALISPSSDGTLGRQPTSFPLTRFSAEQVKMLVEFGKAEEIHPQDAKGHTSGFCVHQHAKRRDRPVAEPFANQVVDRNRFVPLAYPTRLERRRTAAKCRFVCEYDFASYYDHFELSDPMAAFFAFRWRDADGVDRFFRWLKMPMGAAWACGVAQMVTWLIVLPWSRNPNVDVSTCIDNIRIGATNAADFVAAARDIAARAARAGVLINDIEKFNSMSNTELAEAGRFASHRFAFLGEIMYYEDTAQLPRFANAERHVDNLRSAWKRLQRHMHRDAGNQQPSFAPSPPPYDTDVVTLRQFASLLGLTFWMSHTMNIPMSRLAHLTRTSAAIAIAADDGGWDSPLRYVSPATAASLGGIIETLLQNIPVEATILAAPSKVYDVIINTDASAAGWAAFVHHSSGEAYELREGWSSPQLSSTTTEPLAAAKAIAWARRRWPDASVAVATDHEPMVTGQRCWVSGYKGYSPSYHLNTFFSTLYATERAADVFFVPGAVNPADGPSRAIRLGHQLVVAPAQSLPLCLSALFHPYREESNRRKYFQV